jgi:hypothetical protein
MSGVANIPGIKFLLEYGASLGRIGGFKHHLAKPLALTPDWAKLLGVQLPPYFETICKNMLIVKDAITGIDAFTKIEEDFIAPKKTPPSRYYEVVGKHDEWEVAEMRLADDQGLGIIAKRCGFIFTVTESYDYFKKIGLLKPRPSFDYFVGWVASFAGGAYSVFGIKEELNFLWKAYKGSHGNGSHNLYQASASGDSGFRLSYGELAISAFKIATNVSGIALAVFYAPCWTRDFKVGKLVATTSLTASLILKTFLEPRLVMKRLDIEKPKKP